MTEPASGETIVRLARDGEPGAATWSAICERVDAWEGDDQRLIAEVVPRLNDALAPWDDAHRVAPRAWIDKLLAGEPIAPMGIARTLDLRARQLGAPDAELLAASEELVWMRRLHLAYNGLQDVGTATLFGSAVVRKVTWLDLAGNSIGTEGVRALANSPHLKGLTHLDLTGNWVDDEGARLLADSEALGALQSLVLRGNPIRDEGAAALAGSEHLSDSIKRRWMILP